jgi:hypothetical protein
MSDPVNLRQVRKRKQRDDAARRAADNRVRFGRSGTDRRLAEAMGAIEERRHAGHRILDRGSEEPGGKE